MTVIERDHGARRIADLVRRMSGPRAPMSAVGVQGAAATVSRGDDLDGVGLAIIHEFGARLPDGTIIPARSFLRGTLDEHHADILAVKQALAGRMIDGSMTPDQAAELLGLYVVGLVQKRIAAGIEPGLADATIERKGSSVPLIETGQLRASIIHTVRTGQVA